MNWEEFVNHDRAVRVVNRAKSHGHALMAIVQDVTQPSTLANWVRETNSKLAQPQQMTLDAFS